MTMFSLGTLRGCIDTARTATAATRLGLALAPVLFALLALPGQAATSLADQPLAANAAVPGNLSLSMSVEFPTAVSVAHQDTTYASASTYLGYFDPNKCYVYKFVDVESSTTSMSHFAPKGLADTQTTGSGSNAVTTSLHTCTGINDYMWSGNFLNWASMQTIDPFRWAMTGGYRVVDIPSLTLVEKAWASGQGGTNNFPDKVVSNATDIANATPFVANGSLTAYVQGRGQKVNFVNSGAAGTGGFLGTYFKGINLDYDGVTTPVVTRTESINFPNWGSGNTPQAGIFASGEPFSARWVSLSTAPSTGTYQFQATSDDGIRVWINGGDSAGNPQINQWGYSSATYSTSVTLTAGQPLNVRVEYYQGGGPGNIILSWKPPGASSFVAYPADSYWYVPIRAKVCDFNAPGTPNGLEANCQAYANGYYKPEGLMQQYAKKIRYSVFSYTSETNVQRDGGVLRAQQKFIAPTKPVPGSADVSNSAAEWDATTGVQLTNPDAADATSTSSALGISITNSGALNYLNKFGELIPGNYRQFDPVSELFYASLRYYKNQGNVPAWSDMSGATTATRTQWADGFPIITSWVDPIQYSCQKNFILGIGDVNTNADANVPGGTRTGSEPPLPAEVAADTTVNATTATNKVGVLQGYPNPLATAYNFPSGCCNNHTSLIAGLAYDANTKDIRPDLAGMQTVQTFWVDVLEWQVYWANNQYYNAAKFGGLKIPVGTTFDPYTATAASIPDSWWRTNTDTVGSGGSSQPRPDNYYTAGRPDQMVDGLTKAFQSIASQSSAAVASNALPQPQVASNGGNISYSATWNSANWTGELAANELTYDATTGAAVITNRWLLSAKLGAQLATTGWDTNRRMISWNTTTKLGVPFRLASLDTAQQNALTTPYLAGITLTDYLNYLRGDRTKEGKLRTRASLLGDIVGAKPVVVGPPSLPLSNSSNPGYSAFKTAQALRNSVVYFGSNDGMLHAVNGNLSGTDAGKELWAYVPGSLYLGPTATPATTGLASLGNPSFTHHAFVDAPPNVYDMDMGNTAGNFSSPQWKSVLIGGLGKGGKAYYAIDVTDPVGMIAGADNAAAETNAAGKVMWEFTDSRLGYTYGQPAIVKTRQHGWVVIVPSGYNNADGQGYFFIINARTGALIQALATGAGSTANDAGLAQINAFVLDRTDGTADAAYAGDLLGNVWRVDLTTLTGAYPAPLKMATLADSGGTAQPVTSRPLIEVHPTTKRRYLLIGTGRLLDLSDSGSTQTQSYYAIIDGTNAKFNADSSGSTTPKLPAGISFPITRSNLVANTNPLVGVTVDNVSKVGWYLDIGSGWRDVSDSATFFGKVSFAATLPGGNACAASTSRLYSVDFDNGTSELLVNGALAAYITPLAGITDIQNLSVSGQRQLTLGLDDKTVSKVSTAAIPPLPLRRLNWREVPVAN